MTHARRFAPALFLAASIPLTAFQQPQPPQEKPQLPKSQMPDLGRPTRPNDEQPLFDFEQYFPGTWKFEWDVPEGVLGASGTIKGTVTYKKVDAAFFEAETKAIGPAGPFTVKETIAYRKEGKTAARWVTDSRGFSYAQLASVGGDLGGYFNIYYESAPFQYGGKTVRIKNALRLVSPIRYRNLASVSVDGGPYANYGNPWFEKQTGLP
ncbi:MAG TPA: hypothetical protein VKD69_27035 [Vicinamibacterales bacterium]|nr:hypothetical protein [Vicinamibacterales bacterium]